MDEKTKKKEEIKQLIEKVTHVLDKRQLIVTNSNFSGENTSILSDKLRQMNDNK